MKIETTVIENPSEDLLMLFRKIRAVKEENKAKLIAKKDFYFPKSK
jgi:hypothetical protein